MDIKKKIIYVGWWVLTFLGIYGVGCLISWIFLTLVFFS